MGAGEHLTKALGKARIVSRGPKATGALRAAGCPRSGRRNRNPPREVVHYLAGGGINGLRIAVQLHGAFDQLVAGIAERKFDAVRFTSAPAVAAMLTLMRAVELGLEDRVLSALRTDLTSRVASLLPTGIHAMCVGPVTARPLVRLGVPTSAPGRMRLGALARHDAHAVETAVLRLRTALGDKQIVSTVVKRGYRLAVDEYPAGAG